MGDPTLTALIEEALNRNQTVRAGWARVRQARYVANQVRAARMPQIGVVGEARDRQTTSTPSVHVTSRHPLKWLLAGVVRSRSVRPLELASTKVQSSTTRPRASIRRPWR